MKKLICILTALLVISSLSACAEKTDVRSKSGGKTVEDVLNERATEEKKGTDEAAAEQKTESATDPAPTETDGFLPEAKNGDIDVDLTQLNSTMVYAQVNDMLMYPDKYTGMKVRMRGPFAVYETEERNYYAVIITDATACCSTGIEFLLTDEPPYPSGYPEKGTEITVTGYFHTYAEGPMSYPELYDAEMDQNEKT